MGKKGYFSSKFKLSGDAFARAYGSSNTIYNIPRIVIEFAIYSTLISIIYIVTSSENDEFSRYVALISVFGFGLFKILPSFQQIYSGLAHMSSNTSAFTAIVSDLQYSRDNNLVFNTKINNSMFNGDIKLTNVIFRYDKSVQAQIDDIKAKLCTVGTILSDYCVFTPKVEMPKDPFLHLDGAKYSGGKDIFLVQFNKDGEKQ